jgi:MFS transporter, AAHS family, 4-hydroxybenzoate transporter
MLYFTLNWLPTLLTLTGLSNERALLATVLVNTSGFVGAVTWGRLMDRAGAFPVMATVGVLASLGMALLSVGHVHPVLLVAALLVSGMSVLGAVPGLYAVIASVYPTPMRSTGVGAVLGAGRLGSVLGPAAGGLLLALGWSISTIFLVVAALGLGWALGLWLVGRLPRRFA